MNIIGLACLTYLMVNSEPTIRLRMFLGFKDEDYESFGNIKATIYRLITCEMCLGFWIGLIGWFVLPMSIFAIPMVAVLAQIIKNKL